MLLVTVWKFGALTVTWRVVGAHLQAVHPRLKSALRGSEGSVILATAVAPLKSLALPLQYRHLCYHYSTDRLPN
jgi:hypothetical protein